MIKKIFKYQLQIVDEQTIAMPKFAEILCIQTQNEVPCIWALVDPNENLVLKKFEIFGTGHTVSDNINREYVGTYQLANGSLILHCFEIL